MVYRILPVRDTIDCILVVGLDDPQVHEKYQEYGAVFMTVDEALDLRLPPETGLMMICWPAVDDLQKAKLIKRASNRGLNYVLVHNPRSIPSILSDRLTKAGGADLDDATNNRREFVLKRLPGGTEFNVSKEARRIREEAHAAGMTKFTYLEIRTIAAAERAERRKATKRKQMLHDVLQKGGGGSRKARSHRPDPDLERAIRAAATAELPSALETYARNHTCNTLPRFIQRLFRYDLAEYSDYVLTKALHRLAIQCGFPYVSLTAVYRQVVKIRQTGGAVPAMSDSSSVVSDGR